MLVRVLDGIRKEAAETKHAAQYACGSSDLEAVWQARARAYIHLYLKVMFGLSSFQDRENYVTDGGRDGGIDGYFIDTNSRTIYVIQSKFRITEDNFEKKPIELGELLSMQIKRVLGGEDHDEQGFEYNGKIKGLQRRVNDIPDIGRYGTKVIIIANIENVSSESIKRLTGYEDNEIIDFAKSYSLLLYPVVSGTLFRAVDIGITIDLSNKSTGAKIGYNVAAGGVECDITVVFVPTIEIARVMSLYKNSVLSYNPRSYLEFLGEKVNEAIRESVLQTSGNDFALLNNGITIVCDESSVNEQSGRKNKAQLFLLNPQIINGGQTAYTLSRIYEDTPAADREAIFAGKEVMVKAIAVEVSESDSDQRRRVALIEKISAATNNQTPVTIADRGSGDPLNIALQQKLFETYGLFYERKRGEFAEGIRHKYLGKEDIISRIHFSRLYLTANDRCSKALKKRITIQDLPPDVVDNDAALQKYLIAESAFNYLRQGRAINNHIGYVLVLPRIRAAVIMAARLTGDPGERGHKAARLVVAMWQNFLDHSVAKRMKFVRVVVDRATGEQRSEMRQSRDVLSSQFDAEAKKFFGKEELE